MLGIEIAKQIMTQNKFLSSSIYVIKVLKNV